MIKDVVVHCELWEIATGTSFRKVGITGESRVAEHWRGALTSNIGSHFGVVSPQSSCEWYFARSNAAGNLASFVIDGHTAGQWIPTEEISALARCMTKSAG
jgi:hypothetical protein